MVNETVAWSVAPAGPADSADSASLWASPARRFAVIFGAVYALVGMAGFLVTGLHDFAGPLSSTLVVFAVNPLHNIVHVLLGVAWLAGSRSKRGACAANIGIGAVLGLVTVLGFANALSFLGINGLGDPDNFLHLVTAAMSLYFGSAGAEASAYRSV
jgi:hypothetical protein